MAFAKPQPPIRVYVKVNSDFDSVGSVTPRAIIWKDGRTFKIDSVRDFRPASTLGPGHSGDCYTVIIKGMNFLDGATTRLRNRQIGGHAAEQPTPASSRSGSSNVSSDSHPELMTESDIATCDQDGGDALWPKD